jgi:dihydroorotate dehydrogenase (NAD+) catalytic subunit
MELDITVKIGKETFPNPVGVASGTFGYGEEYESLINISKLGTLYTKAVTVKPRPGNAPPRIVETPSGMLNTIGLANPGLEAFVAQKLPELRQKGCPVVVNVAGSSEEEYLEVIQRLESEHGIAGYELNLSCPNVAHGGLTFGTDVTQVERITRKSKDLTKRPLIVKLTPNVTDITEIAKAAEAGGADALTCINTLVGMVIDVYQRKPVLSMKTGGLSGPAIRPVGVACVYKVHRAVKIPVIGVGGIMKCEDAMQYFLAGASAIQVGTGTFVNPGAPEKILAGIGEFMRREGYSSIKEINSVLP